MPGIIRYGRWVSLVAAIGLTATAEHDLLVRIGTNWWLAWLGPLALDVYATCAFASRRRPDIMVAIGLMVVAQSLAHLLAAGQIHPSPALTITVAGIFPVVLWRVERIAEQVIRHRLPEPRTATPEVFPNASVDAPEIVKPAGSCPDIFGGVPVVDIAVSSEPSPAGFGGPERERGTHIDRKDNDGGRVKPETYADLSPDEVVALVSRWRVEDPKLTQLQAAIRVGRSDRTLRTYLANAGLSWGSVPANS